MILNRQNTIKLIACGVIAFTCSIAIPIKNVLAEGTSQMNNEQYLSGNTNIYVDVLQAGETINVSVCQDSNIDIYDIAGTPADQSDDVLIDSANFTANLDCGIDLPNPIPGAHKFTPSTAGTYRIYIDNYDYQNERYDISVTSSSSSDPDPTATTGRVWSYQWYFNAANSNDPHEYPEDVSTDANLFALVPAPNNSENFVWKLDLNNFSGGSYRLVANSTGLPAPYAGQSVSRDLTSSPTPEYPIYLGYPAKAGAVNSTLPSITGQMFRDDANEDETFSPSSTPGVQDTGEFRFNSSVSNATYAITIDTNEDGRYGTGDRLLLGAAQQGVNVVAWDGKKSDGSLVQNGNYSARVQLRIGEFHFIARDVEVSGGSYDNNTWANGLTIYRATSPTAFTSTLLFWDDISFLRKYDQSNNNLTTELYSDAVSTLPNGVMSGDTTDANNDGKADGFHTWGDFEEYSLGDRNYVDTYTYGESSETFVNLSVAGVDGTDSDGISSGIESGALNSGDGNGDGIQDHLQNNVTSLPNNATGAYSTIAVAGCTDLNNVSIATEPEITTADQSFDYPLGLIIFNATCANPGDTATVTVYYDKEYDPLTLTARKYANGVYSNIDGATFATAMIGSTKVTTMSYQITDGGAHDEDGIANGTIVDPAGPGVVPVVANIPSQSAQNGNAQLANTGTNTYMYMIVSGMLILGASTALILRKKLM